MTEEEYYLEMEKQRSEEYERYMQMLYDEYCIEHSGIELQALGCESKNSQHNDDSPEVADLPF